MYQNVEISKLMDGNVVKNWSGDIEKEDWRKAVASFEAKGGKFRYELRTDDGLVKGFNSFTNIDYSLLLVPELAFP